MAEYMSITTELGMFGFGLYMLCNAIVGFSAVVFLVWIANMLDNPRI